MVQIIVSKRKTEHLGGGIVAQSLQLLLSIKYDTFGVQLRQSDAPLLVREGGRDFHPVQLRSFDTRPRRISQMADDYDKVWPTGLTLKEAEEVHSYLIDGTRVFGAIALIAHVLVAISTPWLG